MTDFAIAPEALQTAVAAALGAKAKQRRRCALGELTWPSPPPTTSQRRTLLRDAPGCSSSS